MRGTLSDANLKYSWQQVVLNALIEYPPVRNKVLAAKRAIFDRLCEQPDGQELAALRNALLALRMVFPETMPAAKNGEQHDRGLV